MVGTNYDQSSAAICPVAVSTSGGSGLSVCGGSGATYAAFAPPATWGLTSCTSVREVSTGAGFGSQAMIGGYTISVSAPISPAGSCSVIVSVSGSDPMPPSDVLALVAIETATDAGVIMPVRLSFSTTTGCPDACTTIVPTIRDASIEACVPMIPHG
jgi:hypothetical protein